jgi:hypothetical protein
MAHLSGHQHLWLCDLPRCNSWNAQIYQMKGDVQQF